MCLICSGEVSVVLVGGIEVCIDFLVLGSFYVMKVLLIEDVCLEVAFCFFDQVCSGFVMGEGVGLLVIEMFEYVIVCGVEFLVYISGYGISVDVYYIIVGCEDGLGVAVVIQVVLYMLGLEFIDIDYVNVYVILMSVGDFVEIVLLWYVFGERLN